jgi:hypothetical protein
MSYDIINSDKEIHDDISKYIKNCADTIQVTEAKTPLKENTD